ncbi:MAG: anthranilate synthase component I family protein [Patescibacteria group bacterium]
MNSYRFVLIDKTRAYQGDGYHGLITSWLQLKKWYCSGAARHQLVIGFINYEQDQVYFGIFDRFKPVSLQTLLNPTPFKIKLSYPNYSQYKKAINKIIHHLSIGDIYQANYCYRLSGKTRASLEQIAYRLLHNQPTPYAAIITTPDHQIVCNSPELGIRLNNNLLETKPMKGTASVSSPRSQLLSSAKEKAELDMIIDVHRNDLNRVCLPGSVVVKKRREIIKYKTVYQAQAVIQGMKDKHYNILDVLKVMLPFGSVTGAPKQRAVEILQDLETQPRDVYCGAMGYIAGRNQAEFNIAIRTATLRDNQLHYYVGGGITLASTPAKEYQETLTKARLLLP